MATQPLTSQSEKKQVKRICVFCGSSPGTGSLYLRAAQELGRVLAEKKILLVYGGAKVGVMGRLAKACLEAGGEVIGVIPRSLAEMEVADKKISRLLIVDSMHERKAKMAELSDGFIALPGGLGTIEEFFEMLTWAQLGMHRKPCGLLNTAGYFDKLLDFLNHAVERQFIEVAHREMIQVGKCPEDLLTRFETYRPPQTDKAAWVLRMTDKANEP